MEILLSIILFFAISLSTLTIFSFVEILVVAMINRETGNFKLTIITLLVSAFLWSSFYYLQC
jgi:hypothetical protein